MARGDYPRSPNNTGSNASRRRSRSPSGDRRHRERNARDDYRSRPRSPERRSYHRDDDSYRPRRERSPDRSRDHGRERRRSPDRAKDRRQVSRDRGGHRDHREDSRERRKRRRDDSAEGRSKYRREERPATSDSRSSDPKTNGSKLSTPQPPSKEDLKSKLQRWKERKEKQDTTEKTREILESSGSATLPLSNDTDSQKAQTPDATSVSTPIEDKKVEKSDSRFQFAGKFDPKDYSRKKKPTAPKQSATLDGGFVPHVSQPAPSAAEEQGIDHRTRNSTSENITINQSVQVEPSVSQPRPTLAFEEEEEVTKKAFTKLPDMDLEDEFDEATANDDEDGDDNDLEGIGSEEEEVAAARAAAERRKEALEAQEANKEDGQTADTTMEDAPPTVDDVENVEDDEDADPLDAFMKDLRVPDRTSIPESANNLQQEPEVFEEDDEFTTMQATGAGFLNMQTKTRKKKELPEVDHAKVNYEPIRKKFYTEPAELANLSKDEVEKLRVELEGIKVKGDNVPAPVQKWSQFGLGVQSLGVIQNLGFEAPTPIQSQAVPAIMSGRDLVGVAKTGSGKTVAFLLPMFRHIKDQRPLDSMDGPIGLVLAPTRELATQIHKECRPWLKALGLRAVCAYGGPPIKDQIAELKRGAEIVVCTPGRMYDLLCANQGRVVNLRRVTYLVLDEADRMFDMGFEPQVMKILKNIRPDRQTLLFSATFPKLMESLSKKAQSNAVEIVVGGKSVVSNQIKQVVEIQEKDDKFFRLLQLLGDLYEDPLAETEAWTSLVFVDRQESAEWLMNELMKKGYPSNSLHGAKDQYDRDSVIADFKAGIFPVLTATSVAARGLDVKRLKMVVNYDAPNHLEDYVHRCGRTGRAGQKGLAVTFLTSEQDRYAAAIEIAMRESGQEVPEPIKALADKYTDKIKSGTEQKDDIAGFRGKGIEKLEKERAKARKREQAQFKEGDDEEEAGQSEQKDDKKKTESSMDKMPEIIKTAGEPGSPKAAPVEGPDLITAQGVKVYKTEKPAANQQDRMDRLSASVANINARLRKTGDIRGNAPIDNKGPDAGAYHASIEINDFPQRARWAVTNRTNVAKILESTGTSITNKGNFYPKGAAQPGPDDLPKLSILIEGETEGSVEAAIRELTGLLKTATDAAEEQAARAPVSGRYTVV